MAQLRIGVSGWSYDGWRGNFYPADLPRRRSLEYISARMNSVEINGSFYSLQRPSTYRRWYEQVPDDFVFSVKGSRYITHMKKLKDIEIPLANFFASGILRLADKLGPLLWQFPERLRYRADRFERFLELLPRTTHEAAALAARHDPDIVDESWLEVEYAQEIRHTFEPRHPTFFTPDFIRLLGEHDAALVIADSADTWPSAEEATADFVYIRLHGADELYTSNYAEKQLEEWARRIRIWQSGCQISGAPQLKSRSSMVENPRDVYVYFDNDARGHAPFNALQLARRLQEE